MWKVQKLQNIIWDRINDSALASNIAGSRKKRLCVTLCIVLGYWKHLFSIDTACSMQAAWKSLLSSVLIWTNWCHWLGHKEVALRHRALLGAATHAVWLCLYPCSCCRAAMSLLPCAWLSRQAAYCSKHHMVTRCGNGTAAVLGWEEGLGERVRSVALVGFEVWERSSMFLCSLDW